ncbi:aminocarboxymuconate-semialdehyde decarboxylase [Mycobacterium sp. AT1]|nr:aminocarboxymuconate-semialdehyde decarboxylase [Mycobacterium sp. AT1]
MHTHLIDPDLAPLVTGPDGPPHLAVERIDETTAMITLRGKPYRTIDDRCWSPQRRIADMDRDGIAVHVLSPIPVTFCYDTPVGAAADFARAQNEFSARLVTDDPDRFAALGTVPLQDPDVATHELRRIMSHPGFLGIEIGAQVAGIELADPSLDEFFCVAAELNALVLVHPVDQDLYQRITGLGLGFGLGMPVETAIAAAALLTGDTMRRRPGVRYCLAHGGGALPAVLGRVDKGAHIGGMPIDSPDLPSQLARQMCCDSIAYDHDTLLHAVHTFGDAHVFYGSDYPFPAMPGHPESTLGGLPLPLRDDIAGNNIRRLVDIARSATVL